MSGSIAFTFPGPSNEESGVTSYARKDISGALKGVEIRGENDLQVGFALGAAGKSKVRAGGALAEGDWAKVASQLPAASKDNPGASVAVDFSLSANEEKSVFFVMGWYHPRWVACDWRWYTQNYTKYFNGPGEVAEKLAMEHGSILKRILAWQEVIYADKQYPIWLREQLVNVMHTITKSAMWACDQIPSADWAKPMGIFGLMENPRVMPHTCIPSDWYACLPFVFFFPDLLVTLLRAYAHYQLPNGEIPLGLGWNLDMGAPFYDILRTITAPTSSI